MEYEYDYGKDKQKLAKMFKDNNENLQKFRCGLSNLFTFYYTEVVTLALMCITTTS